MQKRDNWFKDYQSIPEVGISGKRNGVERIGFYRKEDFKDATVIDVGCYIGQMSFEAEKMGAKEILGVEYDRTAFEKSLEIKKKLNSKVKFMLDDIDNPFFWRSISEFDVSFFLSVIDTQELTNRFGDLARLSDKTRKIMYFEGHNKQPISKYFKFIMDYTNFTQFEYLGDVTDSNDKRVMIRCSRNVLNSEQCVDKIKTCKYNKIAVIGKCNAGKSHIREKLEKINKKYVIVDDLKTENKTKWIGKEGVRNIEKIVLFDYRALEYIEDFDVVFLISTHDAENFRETDKIVRSSTGSFENVKEFYTVFSR